jgi:sugar O-acyltransferase (sialic acid O-acetyltransferase NeuD family)
VQQPPIILGGRVSAAGQSSPVFTEAGERRTGNPDVACVILGGGGHARVLVDCLLETPALKLWGILDRDCTTWGATLFGVKVAGGDDLLPCLRTLGVTHFVVGLGSAGDNAPRERLFRQALAEGLQPLAVQHPSAQCSSRARLGSGVQVLAGVIVNAGAEIGANVLLNTGSIVEHDCRLADHVHLATGARLAGNVEVHQGAHIGAGATVRQGITIGAGALVGAGAVVVDDVDPGRVVVGVPARPQRRVA